jgi:hypothetical protein
MADELIKLWGGLSLSTEESKGVFVKKPTVGGLVSRGNFCWLENSLWIASLVRRLSSAIKFFVT